MATLHIHFWLNNQEVQAELPPGLLVLDYLRQQKRLVGTKEGCREGDCGACTVLIGEMNGDTLVYKAVPSCLVPVGELHGKHLVTIEGLNGPRLNPAQQAIVDEGATQCGFCTPGIVVSLTGHLMQPGADLSLEGIKKVLSGHLCRCTGYRSLKAVHRHLQQALPDGTGIPKLVEQGYLPEYFLHMPERLKTLPAQTQPDGRQSPQFIIAGGTDIYVQKGEAIPRARVHLLNLHPELKGIRKDGQFLRVGALTTFEDFARHPEVRQLIPEIDRYMFRIASLQIRQRATLGGNIINASPIGDMTILLLAMQAEVVLQKQKSKRRVPLTEFFLGYKKLNRQPGEILTEILIPLRVSRSRIHWEKVSKRRTLDIASVNSAICLTSDASGIIREVGLAMGGVAPVPLFLKRTCAFLIEKPIDKSVVEEAIAIAMQEISPISDIRGSALYKRLLVRQLMIAHFTTLFPNKMKVRDYYEVH